MCLYVIDLTIERIAQLAQENALPQPIIDLSSITTSATIIPMPNLDTSPAPTYTQPDADPWSFTDTATAASGSSQPDAPPAVAPGPSGGGAPIALTGGLGKSWWNKQAKVEVSIIPEKQGFILARYTAYLVSSDV